MSFTLQRPGLHGVGPTSHDDDDNDPPPSSAGSILTKTTKNDEYDLELEPEKRQAYPSPPRTGSNASRNIPLPGYEEEKHSETLHRQVAFTGGVLDSPILYYNLQNHPPLSPPPTLPTLTAALPSTFNDGTTLEQGTRHDLAHSLLTKPSAEMDSSAETHLFSPLSPFVAGTKIAEDLQHSRLPEGRGDLGVEDASRTMIPMQLSPGFGLGPLDMDALLLGDGNDHLPSSSMFEEDRRPWTPHSLYSSLNKDDFNEVNTIVQPDCIRRPYPSPQISPEQRVMSDSSHYLQSPSIPNMQSLEPDFEISSFGIYDGNYNDPDNSYFDAPGSQSPSVRALGLPELEDEDNEMDLGLELSNLASFPTIVSEEEDLVFSPPPSSSSLPSSTDHLALENTPLSSPPTLSSSSTTSGESDYRGSGSPNFDNSDRSDSSSTTPGSSGLLLLGVNTDIDLTRQSYHQHLGPLTISPSSSPPSSLSSSLSDSPISLLESLDSRLFHLPSLLGTGEYPTLDAHPELLEDLYKLLELRRKTTTQMRTSNPWETEKGDTHSRQLPPYSQQDEDEDVNSSRFGGGSQMRFCGPSASSSQEQHSSSANTMDVETMCKSVDQYSTLTSSAVEYRKPTSKQMKVQDQWKEDTDAEMRGAAASVEIMKAKNLTKQVQNKTSEARAMRKREKERCKEIGALVQLTLFGEKKSRLAVEAEATADLVEVKGEFVKALATIKTATVPLDSLSEEATKDEKRKMEIKMEGLSRKSKKKKVSVTSMAQLVARMVLRRRDPSYSSPASAPFISRPGSGLRPYPHTPMTSPPRGGPRRYGKSPLWQCMTLESSRDGDDASGVVGDGSGNGNGDESCNVEADEDEDDDDLGLGVGLRLKGLPVW